MRLIDNEDYEKVMVAQTKSTAVADRERIDREDFDYIADQLLGAASMTRKSKIDINDIGGTLDDIADKAVTLTLTTIAPTTMSKAGAATQTLTCTGSGFTPGCTVKLGVLAQPTAYVSPTQLRAQITPASHTTASHNITVADLYRTSGAQALSITA